MLYTHKLSFDLSKQGTRQRISVAHGSTDSIAVELTLCDGSDPWIIPGGTSCVIRYMKANGNGGVYHVLEDGTNAWSWEENRVRVMLMTSVVDVPGLTDISVALIQNGRTLCLFGFDVHVDCNLILPDTDTGDVFDFHTLTEINTAIAALQMKTDTDKTLSVADRPADAAATGAALARKLNAAGGNVSGWLSFTGTTQGIKWKTEDGTEFQIRPYSGGNLLQIVRVDADGKSYATVNVSNEGQVTFGEKALPIGSGGTGAVTAAAARENLGITTANIGAASKDHKHTKAQITDFPTSMPASDVAAWAKEATKPGYTAGEVGAIPAAGGDVSGFLNFGNANNGLQWTMSDGSVIQLRPYIAGNKIQFVIKTADGAIKDAFSIRSDGTFTSAYSIPIATGGTGAKTAADARANLGITPANIGALAEKWGLVSAAANGVLTDANVISTSSATGQYNVPKLVSKGITNNMPADCEMGVRTVHFHSASCIVVKIEGIATDGTASVWYNLYNGSSWKVWKRADLVLESATYAGCYYRYVDSVIEWMNPPMVLNTEYKTVERWQGKAVYTKLLFCGLIPADGQKTFAHNASATHIIRCIASADDGTSLPYTYYPTTIDVMATKTEVQIYAQNRTAEGGNAYVQIWYVKE